MDKSEIISRLEKIGNHAIHVKGESPFVMSLDDGIAVNEAIDMLKEQEPKQVETDMYGNAYCPWCSTDRTIEMGLLRLHLGTLFCPYCGKAVKWHD